MSLKSQIKIFAIILLVLPCSAHPAVSQTLTDRMDGIAKRLMCPVCAGQSVAESSSDLARDMRKVIRKQIESGKSDEEIIAYFRTKYGDAILAAPPMKGFNLVVWLLPPAVAVAGAVFALVFIRKRTNPHS